MRTNKQEQLMRRWAMRALRHCAIKYGMVCRWKGHTIEGWSKTEGKWVVVFNGQF